jgi:hypothetical protein
MQEELREGGKRGGGGTGFIAKSDGLFYVWILPIFHLKLDSSVSLPLPFAFFPLSCVRVALYRNLLFWSLAAQAIEEEAQLQTMEGCHWMLCGPPGQRLVSSRWKG